MCPVDDRAATVRSPVLAVRVDVVCGGCRAVAARLHNPWSVERGLLRRRSEADRQALGTNEAREFGAELAFPVEFKIGETPGQDGERLGHLDPRQSSAQTVVRPVAK